MFSDKIIFSFCFVGSYLYTFIASLCIMNSKERFNRNSLHIPIGFVGGFISDFKISYGFIYFILLSVYQILEEIENLQHKQIDKSWYDIEGYIIGFSCFVYYLYLIKNNKKNYDSIERSESI